MLTRLREESIACDSGLELLGFFVSSSVQQYTWSPAIQELHEPYPTKGPGLPLPNTRRFLPPSQSDLRNHDRLLPSQPVMRQFFKGIEADFYPGLEKVTTSVLPIRSVHDKWDIQLKLGVTYETLGSDLSCLYLLQLL